MSVQGSSELPMAMLLVFGTAKIMGEIFERLRMPNIVGEIIAGVVLGASVLNWVDPRQTAELADLGVIFLLFRVGLEVKASDLVKVGRVASLVALLGVLLPLAMGYGIYIYNGSNQIEALFVGTAMVATSVGITAQVLASKGLLNVRASYAVTKRTGLFARVMNAADKRFADTASVSSNTPVFTPGLPRTFYGGVELSW